MSKLVLVECVSMFRTRYLVEVDDSHPEWACDVVTAEEAKEFSQSHLSETIVSYRQVTEDEALVICDEDNAYCSSWTKEQKIDNFFTLAEDI